MSVKLNCSLPVQSSSFHCAMYSMSVQVLRLHQQWKMFKFQLLVCITIRMNWWVVGNTDYLLYNYAATTAKNLNVGDEYFRNAFTANSQQHRGPHTCHVSNVELINYFFRTLTNIDHLSNNFKLFLYTVQPSQSNRISSHSGK